MVGGSYWATLVQKLVLRVAPLIRADYDVGFSSHDYTWTL